MRHPEKEGGRAAAFADPIIDERAGTGTRPAARPAPGCPLRAAALAAALAAAETAEAAEAQSAEVADGPPLRERPPAGAPGDGR
ncbi:hypothetical protein [Actinomadura violacea]|uniref:Uncharacterized protein n=1 Tax=Actinomadura violacea TaxID=2819934 RepID=A0ABS3RYW4_9ACTN|nr:hypothetical protein [Actinomadura violacea]MBO2461962.1 hypothetical protein [Actinomadura violacea]